jgi:carbamoyltransferase
MADCAPADFNGIAIAKPDTADEILQVARPLKTYDWGREKHSSWLEKLLTRTAFRFYRLPRHRRSVIELNRELQTWLLLNQLDPARLYRVDHHRAHALSAFWASGFDPALVVTCDGQGAGVTATVWLGTGEQLDCLQKIFSPHSMGNFYAAATRALGYKPNRHEGKVTGLAAYGNPSKWDLERVRRLAWVEHDQFLAPCVYGAYPEIRHLLRDIGPKSFAAAFQKVLEEVLVAWVTHFLHQTGLNRIAIAGGVFANVKLNQRLAEIKGVEDVFVFPGMADGGLGHGAAIGWDQDCGQHEIHKGLADVYWGPDIHEQDCQALLKEKGWQYVRPLDLTDRVAEKLAAGKTVAVCRGRMEFGPRALGHRSILYQATDVTVNDWLNRRLRRTEFMPFAPITRMEDSSKCYPNLSSINTARFMTITTDCSEWMHQTSPAVVHVDGTARPQLVDRQQEPFIHQVLTDYFKRTGLPNLINTSFNLHEEPIVCSARDAVRAAEAAALDFLVLGPFLIEIPRSELIAGEHTTR